MQHIQRTAEVALATIMLGLTAPLIALAAVVIYATDRRNPIFSQTRLGKNEQPFTLYKLRTMRTGTPSVASHKLDGSALTPVGSLLRRTKLDELPQLLNVLRGEMALVGPRPGLDGHHELTEARRREGVFDTLPGITGLAQVRGIDMSQPGYLAKTDRKWLETRTFLGDLKLLFVTATGSGSGDALGRP